MSADKMPPLPLPFLYAQELITNGGGVWLGCVQKGICEQAHTPGETGEEVINLHKDEAVHTYAREYAAAQTRELVAALEHARDWFDAAGYAHAPCAQHVAALIAKHKATGEQP